MVRKAVVAIFLSLAALSADEPQLKSREPLPINGVTEFRLDSGKRIPCRLLNTISILNPVKGERVFLQTVFPVIVAKQIIIPSGTYVDGKITDVRRSTRMKGQAELLIRLNLLTLPNGQQRPLETVSGRMTAAISARTSGPVIVPDTTADIILQDPIVFPVEPPLNRE